MHMAAAWMVDAKGLGETLDQLRAAYPPDLGGR